MKCGIAVIKKSHDGIVRLNILDFLLGRNDLVFA